MVNQTQFETLRFKWTVEDKKTLIHLRHAMLIGAKFEEVDWMGQKRYYSSLNIHTPDQQVKVILLCTNIKPPKEKINK